MPNNSGRNSGGVSTGTPRASDFTMDDLFASYANWQPAGGWVTRRVNDQVETLTQSAEPRAGGVVNPPEPETGEGEAEDLNFALESTGAHSHTLVGDMETFASADTGQFTARPVERPPSDPFEPHVSDTAPIRHFRELARDPSNNPNQREQYRSILSELCEIKRREWVENGGRTSHEVEQERRQAMPRSDRPSFGGMFGGSRRAGRSRQPESTQTFFGNIPESSTMTTVASSFGMRVNYPSIEKHPLIVGTHLAGVEIELENLAIEHPSFRYWTAKSDGSLRNNGMEFVCSHPWGGVDLYNAAVEIDGFLFGNNPDDTWRCSTHVHVDVRDMTAAQVKKMILAYVFFERVLFKCSGWHRYKNNFCVALGFAQGQLEDLGNWWAESDNRFLSNLAQRWDKYTAINFLPMGSFGSIEFRISEAKWHKGQLIRLANRFLSLKEVAVANSELSDEQFLNMLMNADPADIIKKGIPKGLTNLQEDLEIGYKLANDILSLAKLRRRSRRMFKPNLEDGSRVITQPVGELFINGWNHCVSHLSQQYPHLEFPDIQSMLDESGRNYVFTFEWLRELYEMMRSRRWTFEVQWFMPQQNRSQLIRLFDQYVRQRREEIPAEVAPVVPRSAGMEWMDEEPSDYEPDEDDEEPSDPEW